MDYQLSEQHRQIKREIRRFAENEVKPIATEYDAAEEYPHELLEMAAEIGLTGAHIPTEYGGVDYSALERALIVEEMFAVDPGIGLSLTESGFGADLISEFGTHEQKQRYLEPVAMGEAIMGSAISEPHAGSDVSSLSTRAETNGDEWVINGNKMWTTNGSVGDYFLVLCRTDPEANHPHGKFSQIMVEADRDGFSSEKITGKLGVRASDTAELVFDDVRVPEGNLIGARGKGFYQQMEFFDELRTEAAAQGVGIAKGALERAVEYAQEREQFDQPIGEFQAIQHKLADMHTRTEAARQLTYRSAWSVDHAEDQLTMLASMAKEFASRVAVDAANEAVQIHGGAGYVNDFDVERLYRDAKITQIYEGTTEIQKNIIGSELVEAGVPKY